MSRQRLSKQGDKKGEGKLEYNQCLGRKVVHCFPPINTSV